MRVNSVFKGVCSRHLAVRCSIAIVMVFCVSAALAFGREGCVDKAHGSGTETPGVTGISLAVTSSGHPSLGRDRELRAKQVNLLVRLIGHRLLMQAGDFTSRVLPVTEVREGTFALEFENNVSFSHDSLITLADNLFPKSQFPAGYTVMVLDCMKDAIVYGFQINHSTPDLLTCQGRNEPAGCYTIEFTFPDFYQREESVAEVTRSKEVPISTMQYRVADSKPQAKTTSATADIDKLVAELKSFKAERKDVIAQTRKIERPVSYGSLISLIPSGMLIVLGVSLLIGRFSMTTKPVPEQLKNSDVGEEPAPFLPALGKYLFDVKGQRLLLGAEVISLTEKECKVLDLLNESFGELIPRETLMQKIWLDEGVITGRSLDMFVSKLRKKLSGDPELRITNVHGKGYKVEKWQRVGDSESRKLS